MVRSCRNSIQLPETLPGMLITRQKLMDLTEAMRNIHFPENNDKLRKATYRLKFEELFYIQLNILGQKNKRQILIPWNCLFKGWG